MAEYLTVLALALLPGAGNVLGGLLAEWVHLSDRLLSLALHAAAGVVLAVVGVELMPRALAAEPPWLPVLAFGLGGAFFIAINHALHIVQALSGERRRDDAGPWVIYAGVALDLFTDGVMIGTGATISLGLSLLIALGQVSADVPEGFASIITFRQQGLSRRLRLLLSASFALWVLLGATAGYWLFRGRSEAERLSVLAFTAGVLTTVVVEELVPQAHRVDDVHLATALFVLAFALFMLLSALVG